MADMFSVSYNQAKRQWNQIGKLCVSQDPVETCNEYDSCLGFYDPGKKVMVKRRKISAENLSKSQRAYTILEDCQKHPNLLDWVTFDQDNNFYYMSEERWSFSLKMLVNYFRSLQTTNPLPCPEPLDKYIKTTGVNINEAFIDRLMLKLMEDVAKGLHHLHQMGFIHRDLNPENIVIVCGNTSMTAKIGNFCTTEPSYIRSRHKFKTISNYPTGFQPIEQIKNNHSRILKSTVKLPPETSQADLFSFGCVLFYSLTLGEHPFGAPHGSAPGVMDSHICRNKLNLSKCKSKEAKHLLGLLLDATPSIRGSTVSLLHSPLFWSASKKLEFFKDASEIMETNGKIANLMKTFVENCYTQSVGGVWRWDSLIDAQIVTHLTIEYQKRTSQPIDRDQFLWVRSLIRLIRNQHSHFVQLSPNILALYRGTLEGMEEYYSRIFPNLLVTVYDQVKFTLDRSGAGFGEFKTKYYG